MASSNVTYRLRYDTAASRKFLKEVTATADFLYRAAEELKFSSSPRISNRTIWAPISLGTVPSNRLILEKIMTHARKIINSTYEMCDCDALSPWDFSVDLLKKAQLDDDGIVGRTSYKREMDLAEDLLNGEHETRRFLRGEDGTYSEKLRLQYILALYDLIVHELVHAAQFKQKLNGIWNVVISDRERKTKSDIAIARKIILSSIIPEGFASFVEDVIMSQIIYGVSRISRFNHTTKMLEAAIRPISASSTKSVRKWISNIIYVNPNLLSPDLDAWGTVVNKLLDWKSGGFSPNVAGVKLIELLNISNGNDSFRTIAEVSKIRDPYALRDLVLTRLNGISTNLRRVRTKENVRSIGCSTQ